MAGFLYYKPGETQQPSLERLSEWNLRHAFDTPPSAPKLNGNSPDGGVGILLGDRKQHGERSVGYYPAEQEWHEGPDWWVGWYKEAKPGPGDLARAQQLPGYTLTMGDGNEWVLPLVRSVDDVGGALCVLPHKLTMDAAGRIGSGEPIEQYRALWESTEWAWLAMVNEDDIDPADAARTVGLLYGANYRLSMFELFSLGLFSTLVTPVGALALAISYKDWSEWSEAQKKTNSLSATPSCGTSSTSAV